MQQLSGLDATFLYLETAEMPMHVGALHVFELPSVYPGRFVTALRKHIASRLPVAPVLRRRRGNSCTRARNWVASTAPMCSTAFSTNSSNDEK